MNNLLLTITIVVFLIQVIGYALPRFNRNINNRLFGLLFSLIILTITYLVLSNVYNISINRFSYYVFLPTFLASFFVGMIISNKKAEEEKELSWKDHQPFEIEHNKGKISYYDAYDNFLMFAGANSGKTKSYGKPLLREYIKNNFAGFIFDYKDFDYTKTAYNLIKTHGFDYKFYYCNFVDLSRTHRFNPIKPSVLKNINLLPQLMTDLLKSYLSKDAKQDEWFDAGLGALKAVSVRFYNDYPKQCTIPHIFHFISANSQYPERIISFIESDPQARALAGGFLSATEKQRNAQLSSVTDPIGDFVFNKEVCYVFSGDDFDFNLIDPEDPKLFSISNSYAIEDTILPVIAMMFKVSSRKFDMKNEIRFVYFMDEGTTVRIEKFESMPSVLREYGVSFSLFTQNEAKIIKTYSNEDLRSIKSNFGNVVLGKTLDPQSQKNYVELFSKIDKIKETKSRSSNSINSTTGRSKRIEREFKYEQNFFSRLKPGEFIGTSVNASKTEYHERFKMFEEPNDIKLPIVRTVSQQDIDDTYKEIVDFVSMVS